MTKIKLIHPHYSGEELKLIQEVLDSEYLVDGPMTREFESLIKTITGAQHAVACTSATTGMEMALRILGVGPGDEVVIPAFTHPATGLAVLTVGATPVIVDVDLETRNTTLERMREAVTQKTRVLMPVSWGGHPLEAEPMLEFCNDRGLYLIDDAACSLGARCADASASDLMWRTFTYARFTCCCCIPCGGYGASRWRYCMGMPRPTGSSAISRICG